MGYRTHHKLTYPPRSTLLASVTNYLNAFSDLEAARARAQARARSVPDADGFVTVTRGTRTGPARLEQANEALVKEKEKADKRIGGGFYRFQTREKAKERERQLRREFEEDLRKVEGMKARRRKSSA
ncbi:MAG: hypothetical protein INR71_15515 [Terriglobus roseus]|nr:hypothetical protein [Terriglobus roseus]